MIRSVIACLATLLLATGAGAAFAQERATAIFAGGCFWCVESDFDAVPGVLETLSGYTGGTLADPTYKQVSAGGTGHLEAVKVTFDPAIVSFPELLTAFWHSVDPTDAGGQFCDRGMSYTTAIFVDGPAQKAAAEASKAEVDGALDAPVVTPILPAGPFYAAEDYHQDYYKKSLLKYDFYRWRCGRNDRVKEVWGDDAYKGIPGDH
ncbi:MAG: peptide-methionine (S)-S-oxide reductase MsrA [Sneathiellaceae bacterium]